MSVFDYVNSINAGTPDMMDGSKRGDQVEKDYNAFMVNRALSYFVDTLFHANALNQAHHLDNKLQYSYYVNTVRPKVRRSKWAKRVKEDDVKLVMECYGYNMQKALDALSLLNPEQLEQLREKQIKGGMKK